MMEMVMLTAEHSSVAATRDLLPLWQPGYGSIDKVGVFDLEPRAH